MTPVQVRMARAALGWSLADLSEASDVDQTTIADIEAAGGSGRSEALASICAALESAGISFIEQDGEGPGVRLRKAPTSEVDLAPQAMLSALREGRAALQAELDMLGSAPPLEPVLLRRLRGSAAEFAGQASFLGAIMEGRDEVLVGEAKQLLSFFQLMRDQFSSLLEGGWAGAKEETSDDLDV